jgi:sulfur relay (sulfurtransferase) DsrC/TusE family protein
MSGTIHKIFIGTLTAIVVLILIYLIYNGTAYYRTGLEDRFYHPLHNSLKPSGSVGHGLGIAGSLFMITGMVTYMVRKRYRMFSRIGTLKYWLEFHIFLCTLGPMLVFFHTALKFGGLVAISFWSMVAVFLSGIIGRFIYIQIPHSVEGRELSLNEVRELKSDLAGYLKQSHNLDEESYRIITESVKRKVELYDSNPFVRFIKKYSDDRKNLRTVRFLLKWKKLDKKESRDIINLVKHDIKLNRRIENLNRMQKLFNYWHVAHLPFALVMLIILAIHVAVTIVFGYRWIF